MSKEKIELIDELIERVHELPHRDSNALDEFRRYGKMIIKNIFGDESEYIDEFEDIRFYPSFAPSDDPYKSKKWNDGKKRTLNFLNTLKEEILLFDLPAQKEETDKKIQGEDIFVVHGHDNAMKQTVARIIEKIDLNPIILHEKPNKSRTIIEKFTDHSEVHFAVVLLSPDDLAFKKGEAPEEARSRARQNVIFELGYFIGKLGRERVVALYKEEENFEMPSDYSGVLFLPFDRAGRWQFDLVKELKANGYDIDANELMD